MEKIAASQPMGVSELAIRLNTPKPTAQRALNALANAGWIRRAPMNKGKWILTTKVLEVGRHVGDGFGLRETALPIMTKLSAATLEGVHLAVLEGSEVVIIEDVPSSQIVRIHWPIGTRSPAYATANGKALLSAMPRERIEDYLPASLDKLTPETITDRAALFAELDVIAARGYAVQRGELRADVASIASPVCARDGAPIASLSLFVPSQRFPDDNGADWGAKVRATAECISGLIGGHA